MVRRVVRWQCCYRDSKGERCTSKGVWRLHFSDQHPFDHIDVCEKHRAMYIHVAWFHSLTETWNLVKTGEE